MFPRSISEVLSYAYYVQILVWKFSLVWGQGKLCLSKKGRLVSCIVTQCHPPLAGMVPSVLLMLLTWCTAARITFLDWVHFHIFLSKKKGLESIIHKWNRTTLSCVHTWFTRCHWTFLEQSCVIRSWLSFPLIFDWCGAVPNALAVGVGFLVFLSVLYK